MAGPKKAEAKGSVTEVARIPAPDREAVPARVGVSPGNTTNEEKKLSILPPPSREPKLHYTHPRQRLTQEKLDAMSKAEIRAVALDRGYEMTALGGRDGIIRDFLKCQENEDGLHTPGDEVDEQGNAIPNLPSTEEFPAIDASRSDEDLHAQFLSEAKTKGYSDDEAESIADGRLADLRAGGDGYTIRTSSAPVPASPRTVQ